MELDREASHYVKNVVRMDPGASFILCDNNGMAYPAKVEEITNSRVVASVGEPRPNKANPQIEIWLLLAQLKGKKIESVISAVSALGVTKICPFFAERSIGKAGEEKLSRWNKIALEACRQCGRSSLPKISEPSKSLKKLLDELKNENTFSQAQKIFCWEEGGEPLGKVVQNNSPVILVIGPEGGLTVKEAEIAQEHGFQNVTLGPRIFRAELAPIVALSQIIKE